MIEAWIGLFGVLVGGCVTAFSTVWIHKHQRLDESRTLRRAIRAEIQGLLSLAAIEQYEKALEKYRSLSEAEERWWHYWVVADEDYFCVYSGNTSRIGLLKAKQAEVVVSFYILAKAWIENMRVSKDSSDREKAIDRLEKNLSLLRQVLGKGQQAIAELSA